MKLSMRITAVACAAVMMLGTLTACQPKKPSEEQPTANLMSVDLPNGNIRTVQEEGTEAELTEVRESLIKASETEGLDPITKLELYENGRRIAGDNYIQARDNKKIYHAGCIKRVVNYPDGYILDIPIDWKVDFSMSAARSTFYNDEMTLHISDETDAIRTYQTAQNAVDVAFRHIKSETYQQANNIKKLEERSVAYGDNMTMYVLKLALQDCPADVQSVYTYVVFYNEQRITWMMFKCIDDQDFVDVYMTYQRVLTKGTAMNTVAFPEGKNDSWNDATRELYNSIKNTDKVMWGLVNGNIENDPLSLQYPILEKQLDFKFPIVTSYTDDATFNFPVEDALKIHNDGRIIQFTFHFAEAFGQGLGNHAPILEIYRGKMDEEFREFARGVVEYGQPMLFRLNNEMNSDWVSWAAYNAMNDPDIFTATWQRMYEIFEEEGANKYLIWIWNPQGRTTGPHLNWNDTFLYFPGANYVDMLGVTGYNFGDESTWASFESWYQGITDYYKPYFADWSWIIAEFGCSDSSTLEEHEGRRAVWIKEMFDCFAENKFPNIKAAVWFNVNDYDSAGHITHEISLGRDPDSREAFREGLDRTQ